MVYKTPDLRRLLDRVLDEVGAVSERDMARVFEIRLHRGCQSSFKILRGTTRRQC